MATTQLKKKNPAINKNTAKMLPLIIDAIQDIKGIDIVSIDLRKVDESPADYFIVCHGNSPTQVSAIADSVVRKIKETLDIMPEHTEGKKNGLWVLVDFFDIIVHVFHKETRPFYRLEELWQDGIVTTYDNLN